MLTSKFISSLRYDLRDQNKTIYSDYEIIDVINSVIKIINNSLIKMKSSLLNKSATITIVDGVGQLPNDFIAIVSVNQDSNELFPHNNYKIEGNLIYTDKNIINIVYRGYLNSVDINDELPLPDWFTELLNKFVIMLLTKQISKTDSLLQEMIYSDISSVVSGREYSLIDREPPFII